MGISNFWFYTIMVLVILHIVAGFAYLFYKLAPKKKSKKEDEITEKDNF